MALERDAVVGDGCDISSGVANRMFAIVNLLVCVMVHLIISSETNTMNNALHYVYGKV